MTTQKNLKIVREALYSFISEKPSEFNLAKAEVDKAVFIMDDEVRITGEVEGNFAMFFVNYYEAMEWSLEMAKYVEDKTDGKFILEWYNPAYMVAYPQ